MRAFVGFFTTSGLMEYIDRLEGETRSFVRGRWVDPKNLHVTLQFLGEISQDQALGVLKNLQELSRKQKPFRVQYRSLGVFPDRKRPRILWIGVSKGEDRLKSLAKEVSKMNKKTGIKPEGRPFHAHVTVCRIKEADRKKLSGYMNRYKNFNFAEETVDRIALISSSLTSIGPIYTVVEEFFFRGNGS
jgi:2'-5' RNA ligase